MTALTFVDLFAGCGGFSLGFLEAGIEGRFAVERDAMAFDSYHRNLVSSKRSTDLAPYPWDKRIVQEPHDILTFIEEYRETLKEMSGTIDVVCGGPPCQGFSLSGKRDPNDPRNQLVMSYLEFVKLVRPKVLVIENVPAMRQALKGGEPGVNPVFERVTKELAQAGYDVADCVLDAQEAGVPQVRKRLFLIGVDKRVQGVTPQMIFEGYNAIANQQLRELCEKGYVTTRMAISDLEDRGKRERRDDEFSARQYWAVTHQGIDLSSAYQQKMHGTVKVMDSMRLVEHRENTVKRYKKLQRICRPGRPITIEEREALGLRKFRTHLLDPDSPAPTLTTIPDDIVHYSEPRVLTVRESARLQSFPDWYHFRGKYSTGGAKRANECPRYTQVGNAVAPLVSKALAHSIRNALGS